MLKYKYKNIHKNVFINWYKQLDFIKNWENLLQKIEKLEPYIIEFERNNTIKFKGY